MGEKVALVPVEERLRRLKGWDVRDAVAYAVKMQGIGEVEMIARWQDAGEDDEQINEYKSFMAKLREMEPHLPSTRISNVLLAAHDSNYPAIERQPVDASPGIGKTPRWPTALEALDAMTKGGAGFVVFAGQPKVGKSMLALGSAIEAARAGWRVLYCNAEMSPDEMARRIASYVGDEWDEKLVGQMEVFNLNVGVTLELALREFLDSVQTRDSRLLIVIDSINRVVDMGLGDGTSDSDYWGAMRKWSNFAMQARRHSEGVVSFLVISELNRRNEVKGQNLEYTADLVVRLSNDRDDRDCAKIDVMLSRSTPSGYLGSFRRDWNRCRFVNDGD